MSGKKTAIVTGASGGIGAGLVEGFLIEGYLQLNPLKGDFDSEHLKAIHSYLFRDVTNGPGNSGRSR